MPNLISVKTTAMEPVLYLWHCLRCNIRQTTDYNPNDGGNTWGVLCPGCFDLRLEQRFQDYHSEMVENGKLNKITRSPGDDFFALASSIEITYPSSHGVRRFLVTAESEGVLMITPVLEE